MNRLSFNYTAFFNASSIWDETRLTINEFFSRNVYNIEHSSYSLTEYVEARAYSLQPFRIATSEARKYLKTFLQIILKCNIF